MSLLTGEMRRRVLQLLLDVPDVRLVVVRRSLVAGLPDPIKSSVADGPAAAELVNVVDIADSPTWWHLPDGSFSVIRIVENALFNVRGSRLERDAQVLLEELKRRGVGASAPPPPPEAPPGAAPAGADLEGVQEALLSAFPSRDELAMLVRFRLNTNLDEVAGDDNLRVVTFSLPLWAEATGRLEELVSMALAERPGNPALREAAERLSLAPSSSGVTGIEAIVPNRSFLETATFLTGIAGSEKAVCRVEVDTPGASGFGTGFLVGPSAVMTAHHVVAIVDQSPEPDGICFGTAMPAIAARPAVRAAIGT